MATKEVYFDYNEEDIAAGKYDSWDLIEPLWWNVNIYDGIDVYNNDLSHFTKSQRKVLALYWYDSEVNNGGHDQFFSNSTGIVWKDAYEGLKMIGATPLADNLKKAIDLFGGEIPFDRAERQNLLEKLYEEDDFDNVLEEIDEFYYDFFEEDISEIINKFVKKNASEFVVNGTYQIEDTEA